MERLTDFRLQNESARRLLRSSGFASALYHLDGGKLRGDGRETALTRKRSPRIAKGDIMPIITENGKSGWRAWPPAGCHLTDDLKARILSTF